MRKPRPFKIPVTTALLALALLSCSKDGPDVRLGKIEVQDIEQRISVSGNLRGKRSSFVAPAYSGYIVDLRVKLGQKVGEGDPLFRVAQTVDQPLSQIFPIRAPFSGIVTQMLKSSGEYVSASQNSALNTESAVLKVDDLSEFWLESAVPEIDIAKVKIGLEAQIRPNALSGKSYKGSVREIGLSSSTPCSFASKIPTKPCVPV
jgi:multidrug efflux pump subunit AcrA (membrane-fusion protein)